jgi:hypothetical protein
VAQITRHYHLSRKYGFNARRVPVGLVVDEDGNEDFLRVLRGFIVSIMLSVLQTQSFIYYLRYIFLKINSSIKNGKFVLSGNEPINGLYISNFINVVKTTLLSSV